MPVSITVTRARTFAPGGDADNDGQADPGDVFLHTIILENLGTDPATNLVVIETENGLTIDPDSVLIGPIGVDDAFNITGNTPITFTLNQLLGNDLDPDDLTPNLTISTSNVTNGNLVDNGDGTYTFTPATGLDAGATASFEYGLTDADGVTSVGSTLVTFNITDVVWYVDSDYGGGNGASDGSYLRPFTQLTELNGLTGDGTANDDVDAAGETIFIHDQGATAYNGGIALEAGQKLFGDGATLSVNGLSIGTSANNSTINFNDYGVTLSTDNVIEGIDFDGDIGASVAIQDGNGSVGSLTIADTNIGGNGKAVDIDQGGTLAVDIDSLNSSSSTSEGIHLQGVSGTFNVDGGLIQTSAGTGILIGAAGGGTAGSGGGATISIGASVANPSGSLVEIQDRTGGSVTLSGTLTEGALSAGQAGILLDGNAGTISFTGQSVISAGAGDGNGVTVTNNSGTINFNAGGTGLDITTGAGTGLTFTGGGTLNVTGANNSITTAAGTIANIANGSTSGMQFGSLTSGTVASNAAIAIDNLDGVSGGTFTGGTVDINGLAAGVDGIRISGGSSANFSFAGTQIDSVITTSGDGIELSGANGTVTFTSVDMDGVGGNGLSVTNATNAVTVSGGTIGASNDPGGDALLISGGTGAVTVNAAISKASAGNVVQISNHTGTVNVGGSLSATGGFDSGILIDGTTAGSITFSGATKTLSTGGSDAVSLTGSGAANVTFSGGNLDIDTTSGTGINATNAAATLTISGGNNSVTVGAGRAVSLDETDSGGIVLQSVTKTGGSATAIFLDNAGSGGFTITGTGTTAGSGGTIGGTISGTDLNYGTGVGFYANNTDNISLSNMTFSGSHQNFAIRGSDVDNFTLRNSTVGGTHGNTDVAEDEGAINFTNLSGVGLFEGNNISGGYSDNLKIVNTGGTLNLFVRDTAAQQAVFGNNSITNSGNDSILVSTSGSSQLFMLVDGVQFTGWRGDAIQTDANGQSRHEITVQNSQFNNGHPNIAAAGGVGVLVGGQAGGGAWSVDYDIHGNQFTGSKGSVIAASFTSTAGGTIRGFIDNNIIGTNNGGGPAGDPTQATTGSSEGGSAIFIRNEPLAGSTGSLTHYTTISNNQIRDIVGGVAAIYIAATRGETPGKSVVEATINNNNVDEVAGAVAAALALISGGIANEFGTIRADINNNVFNIDTATPAGISGVYAQGVIGTNDSLVLPGFGGDFSAYLAGRGNSSSGPPGVLGSTDDVTPTPGNLTQPAPNGTEADLPSGAIVSGSPAPVGDPTGDGSGTSSPGGDGTQTPAPPPPPPPPTPPPPPPPGEPEPPAHPVIVEDGVLSRGELDYLVEAAIQRWIEAGATAEQVAAMRATTIDVAHMAGLYLGSSQPGAILIDSDGAGHGWFLDTSPGEDSEYSGSGTRLRADAGGPAEGRMDLLTVLMHELGHQIGLSDDFNGVHADELMYGHAIIGERRLPGADDLVGADLTHPGHEAFVVTVPTIPVLPAGSAVRIVYTSTVDNFVNGVIPSFGNSTEITYDGLGTPQQSAVDPLDIDSLTLTGTIWSDNGAGGGTANNGSRDGTEAGVANVNLSLLVDANNDNVADSLTAIATATTDANGNYSFTSLAQGNYIVRVDLGNFQSGGALASLQVSSLGAAEPLDPDNDVDNDDNGVRADGQPAFSKTITLGYDGETDDDGTGQLDINDTLDFGFLSNPPPDLTNLDGDVAAFTEGGTAILLDDSSAPQLAAIVTDDQPDFNGGSLSVAVTGNGAAEDVLALSTAGTVSLSAGITVGSIVSVGGLAVGTITSDGAAGTPLVIAFDTTDATPAAATTLIRALTYTNSNQTDPSTLQRTVTITVNDGLAGTDAANVLIDIGAVNDAPALTDAAVALDAVAEDAAAPSGAVGTLVSDLIDLDSLAGGLDNVSDDDSVTGIALTGIESSGGEWFYSLDDGVSWSAVPAVADATALLLAADANTRLYFRPDPDFNGTVTNAITFRAWDRSSGAEGDVVDVGTNGGATAFSAASDTASLTITAANDAPSVTAPASIPVTEDVAGALSGISFADIDVGGATVTATLSVPSGALAATSGGGVTIGGTAASLTLSGTLADINAFLAASGVTFTTAQDAIADVMLSVTIDDGGNSGSGGALTDSTTIMLDVTPVNDVPMITAPVSIGVTEDVAGALTGISFADVDAGGGTVEVTLSVPSGLLVAASGGGVTITGGPSALTLTGTIADINAFIAGSAVTFNTDQNADADVTLTIDINDDGNSGTGGPKQDMTTVTIDVIPVDDPAEARNDSVATSEDQVATGNLLTDNGSGPDFDDGPLALEIAAVNGGAAVGTTIALASGARLTVNADGTFVYDPNGAFDYLAAAGSGASNIPGTDSFTYTLSAGSSATVTVTITGRDTDDRLEGTSGDDLLLAGVGIDMLFGLGGNDQLFGEGGDDILEAGTGNDLLHGGEGSDTLSLAGIGGQVFVNLLTEGPQDTKQSGFDTLISIENVMGGAGADTLRGSNGDNWLEGGSNNDRLYGKSGNDVLVGGSGDDRLGGERGNDRLLGGAGDDRIDGGLGDDTADYSDIGGQVFVNLMTEGPQDTKQSGFDTLISIENVIGGAGADTLRGSNGDNRLEGGSNNDRVYGKSGNDVLVGGSGDDRLGGEGGDDRLLGGAGNDQIDGGLGDDTADYSDIGGQVFVNLLTEGPQDTKQGGFDTLISIENVIGGAGADTLRGSNGDNRLEGGSNNDRLYAKSGNDVLVGGSGDDRLGGEGGDDTLLGGIGDDLLEGSRGSDRFVFDSALDATSNVDIVLDFESGVDVFVLDASVFTGLASGQLAAEAFASGTATTDQQRILYDPDTAALLFDADGSGAGAAILFAVLENQPANLAAGDFTVI